MDGMLANHFVIFFTIHATFSHKNKHQDILTLLTFEKKSTNSPSNYYQIDNIFQKLSIVIMFPPNYQNIVNVPLNDETTSVKKKILKLLEKKKT
jgi:hypothetical protein